MSDEGIRADEVWRRLYDAVVADERVGNQHAGKRDEVRPIATQLELDPATVAAFRELPVRRRLLGPDREQSIRLRQAFQTAVYQIHLYRSVEGGSVDERMGQLRRLRFEDDPLIHGPAAALAHSRFDSLAAALPDRLQQQLYDVRDEVGPPRPGWAYAARGFADRVAPELGSDGDSVLRRMNQEPPGRKALVVAEALANGDRRFGDLFGAQPDRQAVAELTTNADRVVRAGFDSLRSTVPGGQRLTETEQKVAVALGAHTGETAVQYTEDVLGEWRSATLAKDFGLEPEKPAADRSSPHSAVPKDVLAGQAPPTASAPASGSAALTGDAAARRGPGQHRAPERGA